MEYASSASYGKQGENRQPRTLLCHLKEFASDNPGTAALCCLGVGAVVGSTRTARMLSGVTMAAGLGYLAYSVADSCMRGQNGLCEQLVGAGPHEKDHPLADDDVDEAGAESFPASDPPSWSSRR